MKPLFVIDVKHTTHVDCTVQVFFFCIVSHFSSLEEMRFERAEVEVLDANAVSDSASLRHYSERVYRHVRCTVQNTPEYSILRSIRQS